MKTFEKLFDRLIEHHGEDADQNPKTKKIYDASLGSFLTSIGDSDPLYATIERKVKDMAESTSETVKENLESSKNVKFTIKKNDIGEFVVKVWVNGKYDDNKSYFTDDLQDAKNTLLAMKKEYTEKGYNILESTVTEARKKYGKVNPWAVCTKSVGRDDKKKYEKCVKDVKKKHEVAK